MNGRFHSGQRKHKTLAVKLSMAPRRNHGWSHVYSGDKPITARAKPKPMPNKPEQVFAHMLLTLAQIVLSYQVLHNRSCSKISFLYVHDLFQLYPYQARWEQADSNINGPRNFRYGVVSWFILQYFILSFREFH